MESESGRSSTCTLSERCRSMAEARTTPLSRISRPGSAVDLIFDWIGAVQANIGTVQANIGTVQANIGVIQANMGVMPADTRESIESLHADIGGVHADVCRPGALGAAQADTREVLETAVTSSI